MYNLTKIPVVCRQRHSESPRMSERQPDETRRIPVHGHEVVAYSFGTVRPVLPDVRSPRGSVLALDDNTLSMTRAIIALPALSGTSSLLCGRHPAGASSPETTAAINGALRGAAHGPWGGRGFFPWHRPRLHFLQQAPTPIRMMSRGVTASSEQPRQHENRSRQARAARASGSTSAGLPPIWPRQIRLPDLPALPKCRISPPARTIPAGPTSRPVHHRRGTDHQQQVRPRRRKVVQRAADGFLVMRASDRRQQGAGESVDPSLGASRWFCR